MALEADELAQGDGLPEGEAPEGLENEGEGEGPSAEVVSRAKEMGWAEKEKWRGNPDAWIDAEEFVRKGEEVLPLIRASNRKLNDQLSQRDRELAALRKQNADMAESINAIREIQTREATGRIDRQIKVVERQIEDARGERDTDKVLELNDRLRELQGEKTQLTTPTSREEEAEDGEEEAEQAPDRVVQQEIASWQEENDWFGSNKTKTRLMNAVAVEVKADPKFKGVKGRAFLEECARRVDESYEEEFGGQRRPVNKTTGGSNGTRSGSGGGSTLRGKGYNDLPADAKRQCDKDAQRVVGEGKLYKTAAEFQTFYAKEYFGDEA